MMTVVMKNYQAALSGTAFYLPDVPGYLRLTGSDRVDFIQRQSTNDLRVLTAGRFVTTVLTSPTARILDVFHVIDEGETLGLILLPGRHKNSVNFLRSRIFFSDQVAVQDLSAEHSQVWIMGSQASNILQSFGTQLPQKGEITNLEFAGSSVRMLAYEILSGLGYCLVVPMDGLESVLSALEDLGAEALDAETFGILRVEAGMPGAEGELTDEFTPLEMGLQSMVSEAKGCYTGQEIIARQITYDKVTKSLAGLQLAGESQPGNPMLVDGKSVGVLTSVAHSPRFGIIGLGVLRRQFIEDGRPVVVADPSGSTVDAVVKHLPFTE